MIVAVSPGPESPLAKEQFWRIDGAAGDIPIGTHGDAAPESNHTYGEGYDLTATITAGSDDPAGKWPDHMQRYEQLRETYMPHAGGFVLHDLSDGRVAYTQTTTGPSLLVALRPPQRLSDVPLGHGMWALVESVEDSSMYQSAGELTFGFTFVAPLADYQSHTAAREDLESPI